MARVLAVLSVLALGSAGCAPCQCPRPAAAAPLPAPPGVAGAPQGLRLPGSLGPPTAPVPASLEVLMDREGLAHASFDVFERAVGRLAGARVQWRLYSWGGEISEVGFDSPAGTQPADVGRTRLISETLRGTNLVGVQDAGFPVVTCLTRGDSFVRSDAARAPAPETNRSVTIEAIVWGATLEGATPTLWLHDCMQSGPAVGSGLYHLAGQVDAMNLALDLDAGTFRVGVDGCDYEHATQGIARATADGAVLSGDFTWPEGASFANDVETVLLRRQPDGSLRASGEIGGRRFEQEWLAGGVCPDCGHALGPSGQRACARPYLGR